MKTTVVSIVNNVIHFDVISSYKNGVQIWPVNSFGQETTLMTMTLLLVPV